MPLDDTASTSASYGYLEVAVDAGSPSVPVLWRRLSGTLDELGLLGDEFNLRFEWFDEEVLAGGEIAELLEFNTAEDFTVEGAGYEFWCCADTLKITRETPAAVALWDRWACGLGGEPAIVSARLNVRPNYRRRVRDGYVEAVGPVMWLGPTFAARTGADLSRLRAADWCEVAEVGGGLLRVATAPPDADHLRPILFPTTSAA